MSVRSYRTTLLATLALALACNGGEDPDSSVSFTDEEMTIIAELSPAPTAPPDTTNAYADDPAAAALGQKLFFDRRYSGPIVTGDDGTNGGLGAAGESGKVSCRDCHLGDWLIDTRSSPDNTSLGIDWFGRNTPTLVNVATYEEWFGWVGFNDNLWGKNLVPAEAVMGTTRVGIARFVYENYQAEYNAVFTDHPLPDALAPDDPDVDARFPVDATPLNPDSPWASMDPGDQDIINRVFANFGKALAAYERLLISGESPFDRFVAGDDAAISDSAKRGLKLFIGKAACVECHAGPTFSDEQFHVTGVAQEGEFVFPEDAENGRTGGIGLYLGWDFNTAGPYNDDPTINKVAEVTDDPALLGAFRTKGLRNVAETAPFLHTGALKTLADVVEFYDQGGAESGFQGTKDALMVPLNLTADEKADLVAFLETLTGDPVDPALLVDTSAQ